MFVFLKNKFGFFFFNVVFFEIYIGNGKELDLKRKKKKILCLNLEKNFFALKGYRYFVCRLLNFFFG